MTKILRIRKSGEFASSHQIFSKVSFLVIVYIQQSSEVPFEKFYQASSRHSSLAQKEILKSHLISTWSIQNEGELTFENLFQASSRAVIQGACREAGNLL